MKLKRPQQLRERLFFWSASIGTILTLLIIVSDAAGILTPIENWIYDHRARWCQKFNNSPSNQIVHLDIDDKAIDAVGRWPWPRGQFAKMFEELARAKPRVVAVDIVFSEPTQPVVLPDGKVVPLKDDEQLAIATRRLGNVVSTISLNPRPPVQATSVQAMALSELTADLELSPLELKQKLTVRGASPSRTDESTSDDVFLATRRHAVGLRIERELSLTNLPLPELRRKVLPRTDLSLRSPLLRLVDDQYARALALKAAQRFSVTLPASIPSPLPTELTLVPIIPVSESSVALGFVDADTTEAVQRYVPLYAEHDRRLFPQFGFAFGCRMIGSDPSKAEITPSSIKLPTPSGTVEIPVRTQTSKTFGRDLNLFVDIPWFGTSEWQSMYDWPDHKSWKNHISLGSVWQIVELRERLRYNNHAADEAIEEVLSSLAESEWKAFSEQRLDPENAVSRMPAVRRTLELLEGSEDFKLTQQAPETLNDQDKIAADGMRRMQRDLRSSLEQSARIQAQIEEARSRLAQQVSDKGVIIGWTATSLSDLVTTPLHARCPGVVVHGVIANAIITGNWWRVSPVWIAYVLTMVFGIAIAVIVGLFRPIVGSLVAIVLFVAYALINGFLVFDKGNYILGAAAPLSAIVIVWAGATLVRAIIEGVERIRAEFEKLRLEKEKAIAEQSLAIFRHEMELAKSVQVALIPTEPPRLEGIDNFGWNKPADLTGGDCYDLWTLPDGRLGILVADASGHGLAPAMIVSQVRTLVRTLAETEDHPDKVLARVNSRLSADLEASRFVTCFLGFISGQGTLTWASAGHGPMLWCEGEGGEMKELESTALPLGIDGDWMGDVAPIIQLGVGGMLLVMSDGIFEAPDPNKDQFGVERVVEIVKKMCGASAIEITGVIREAVTKWQQKDSPADDQTTVIIRRVTSGVNVTVVEDQSVQTSSVAS
jgi:serine phosphatase RsbU (regulator of sigma subunit)/CHASE2 domain-containing sensor protein